MFRRHHSNNGWSGQPSVIGVTPHKDFGVSKPHGVFNVFIMNCNVKSSWETAEYVKVSLVVGRMAAVTLPTTQF
jgi:hypothetical protein